MGIGDKQHGIMKCSKCQLFYHGGLSLHIQESSIGTTEDPKLKIMQNPTSFKAFISRTKQQAPANQLIWLNSPTRRKNTQALTWATC